MIRWRLVAYACIFYSGQEYGRNRNLLCAVGILLACLSFWLYEHGVTSDKEKE